MASPLYTKEIPYYGISASTIIDVHYRPCWVPATTNTSSGNMDNSYQRHRTMEDFNEHISLEMNDDMNRTNCHEFSAIERTPLRGSIDRRSQSARNHWDIIDDANENDDDVTTTMMRMIRNGTLSKPPPKRARSTSAPQINPLYTNDLLDLLDVDDCDEKVGADSNYMYDYEEAGRRRTNYDAPSLRSQSYTDVNTTTTLVTSSGEYPFYHYMDHSCEVDMTPGIPLTAMGRVPTFLAKLHAILLRPELQSIVGWLPHGRSWKVHKASEFEKHVIAVYFEFTKHPNSSFFRQAKLWGFLRMKHHGNDHDSYYHPKFLRGLPHLCKDVRRPPASHLPNLPPLDQEPDLMAISVIFPIPPSSKAIQYDPTIHLDWFMKGKQQPTKHTPLPLANSVPHPPPPSKESIAKKTSSSTTASTSTDHTSSMIIKRKRLTHECRNDPPISIVDHQHEYDNIEPVDVYQPNNNYYYDTNHVAVDDFQIDIVDIVGGDDDDDDEPPIDDDLGLNLDPYFTKGYHLYPFYDYIDYSTTSDVYPLQPYTDIGQEPTFPILLHAILLSQQQQYHSNNVSEPIIRWLLHGRAWTICSMTKFEIEILPLFLMHTNGDQSTTTNRNTNDIGSFFRHVTRWGFKRIEQHAPQHRYPNNNHQQQYTDIDSYYHPKFLRGLPHLCKDWNMNASTSSISTTQLTSDTDDDICKAQYNMTASTTGTTTTAAATTSDDPKPDFTKISQLHPVPEYDPDVTVHDLLGFDW